MMQVLVAAGVAFAGAVDFAGGVDFAVAAGVAVALVVPVDSRAVDVFVSLVQDVVVAVGCW